MTRFLSHSLLVILSFIFLLPFGWIASLAFKRQIDILMTNIISPISYGNFIKLFASKESTFSNDILNSLFVGLSSTLIVLIVCSLASFTLTRLKIEFLNLFSPPSRRFHHQEPFFTTKRIVFTTKPPRFTEKPSWW